ncbi:MAG: zinc-finger domain-containing protein [Proteobacteria bacterium]|nr:zinc-finger domain-containing protein [Pseudomonadota bacterium]
MIESKIEASTHKKYIVTQKDLPLCCPMHDMRLWDSHPRVYLPIEKTGNEVCPYCGSEYILKES